MSDAFLRVAAHRGTQTWWLDAYPGESLHETRDPVRIDAAVVRASSVTQLSWLRSEFTNMEIEGPSVPSDPAAGGVLGNRRRRGPKQRADDAMAQFGDQPADNMVVLVRGRQGVMPALGNFWATNIDKLIIYELLHSSGAVRRALEINDPTQLHRDNVIREPVPGMTRHQEQLIFSFGAFKFRRIRSFPEMRIGMRPIDPAIRGKA